MNEKINPINMLGALVRGVTHPIGAGDRPRPIKRIRR